MQLSASITDRLSDALPTRILGLDYGRAPGQPPPRAGLVSLAAMRRDNRLLLILDDDRTRLRSFEEIASRLGKDWAVKAWRDAPTMIAELYRYSDAAELISLDHDLYRDAPSDRDPGSGRMVADALSKCKPACPVIVHSTNIDAAWGMHNVLRRSGWQVELVHPLSQPKWIEELWLPVAGRLVAARHQPRVPAAAETLSLSEYRALVKPLPVPTPVQLRQFADYIAAAHSWYKHLRVLPAYSPIQVFMNPAAGMQLVQAPDGRVTAEPREKQGFHHSWLRTAEHRERFGYLAFSKSAGTSVYTGAGNGTLVPSDDAPSVYDPAARAFYRLPEEALMAGRAFISAIVHEATSRQSVWQWVIEKTEGFDDVLDAIDRLEIAQRILDRCSVLKENPSLAEPRPPRPDDRFHEYHECNLAELDVPLYELVKAERERQIEGLAAAAARVVRLVGAR